MAPPRPRARPRGIVDAATADGPRLQFPLPGAPPRDVRSRRRAEDRVAPRDTLALVRHEAIVGVILGVASGVLVGLVAWAWQGNWWLGLVVFAGLAANILVGTVFGVLIPMALSRLKQDPALSGGIWLTTATDISGFLAFLGTAALLIDRLK